MCTLASVILCSWYAFCAMPRLRFEKDCLIWLAPCIGVFKPSATSSSAALLWRQTLYITERSVPCCHTFQGRVPCNPQNAWQTHVRLLAGLAAGSIAVSEAGGLRLVTVLARRLLPGGLLLGSCLGSLMLRCRLRHLLCRLRLGQHLQGLQAHKDTMTICFSDVRLLASYIL